MFFKSIVAIKKKWFDDMNFPSNATFPMAMIKRAKNKVNKKINYPGDIKRPIW